MPIIAKFYFTWCTQACNPSLIPALSTIHHLQYKFCTNFELGKQQVLLKSENETIACHNKKLVVTECSLLSYPSRILVLQEKGWSLGYHGSFAGIDNTLSYLTVKIVIPKQLYYIHVLVHAYYMVILMVLLPEYITEPQSRPWYYNSVDVT